VEDTSRIEDPLALARDVLAPEEIGALAHLSDDLQRRRAFHVFWTLKEAYLKARGIGLGLPLDSFAFALEEGGGGAVLVRADDDDAPASWQFHVERPTPGYALAVAVRHGGAATFGFHVRWTVPLADRGQGAWHVWK
jgi:4'-phosphopantetheinyl transferase